jgi:hypothetical protein
MAKRVSNEWKIKVEASKQRLVQAQGNVAVETHGKETVTDSFMQQLAIVRLADDIRAKRVTTADILAARRMESNGVAVVPVGR